MACIHILSHKYGKSLDLLGKSASLLDTLTFLPRVIYLLRGTTGDALFAECLGHSAKALLHSAKSKRQSRIRRRVLCRVPFVGHSASARTALGKENWPSAVDGVFAECRVRKALGKAFPFFFEKSFAECLPDPALGKEKIFFLKNPLPSA